MGNLQFQPPPDWLIQEYMNRKSPIQQAGQGAQQALQGYVTLKAQQDAAASLDAERKAKEFGAVAPYVPEAQIPALGKNYGINIPVQQPTVRQQPSPSSVQPNFSSQSGQDLAVTPQGSPIIAHFNSQMGQGQPGFTPGSPGGMPPLGPRPTSQKGLEKYQKNLLMTKTEGEMAPKMPTTKEDLLKSGKPFDPMSQMIVEPPSNGSDSNKTFIGNDAKGNPLFADRHGTITAGAVPTGGPVLPKTSTMPTSATRGSAEFAKTIIPHINEMRNLINQADAKGFIGPTAGRVYGEFLAGKVGSTGNHEADRILGKLRTSDSLLKSGALRVHFGSRGGQMMYDKFSSLLNTGKQSKDILNGSLDGLQSFMQGYADAGTPGGVQASHGGALSDPLGIR